MAEPPTESRPPLKPLSTSSTEMAERVFTITIAGLPLKDLLRVRSVSNRWNLLVDRTSGARRALFLEPGTARDTLCKVSRIYNEEDDIVEDDIVQDYIVQDAEYGVISAALMLECNEYAIHPMLAKLEAPGPLARLLALDANDNLRQAYLTQPPVLAVMIEITCAESRWTSPVEHVTPSSEETFGTLIERIKKECEGGPPITNEWCGRVRWWRSLWIEKADYD
ncbi:hypothetical protein LTR85_012007 [Meristemomyces frigidus]|nr:hypothetical protein LTR85_012007 [Meristemomyces frigidus]